MTSRRNRVHPLMLMTLVTIGMTIGGCGIRVETMAQPAPAPRAADMPFISRQSASLIFTPCTPGDDRPHAVSQVGNLLLGKDRFAVDCGHRASAVTPAHPAPKPGVSAELVVSDDVISAVLTGTGEYWYQPLIGPA
ncbi:hypothetical protein ACWDUN_15330 [Mycobacterium sp. NPDC003323]